MNMCNVCVSTQCAPLDNYCNREENAMFAMRGLITRQNSREEWRICVMYVQHVCPQVLQGHRCAIGIERRSAPSHHPTPPGDWRCATFWRGGQRLHLFCLMVRLQGCRVRYQRVRRPLWSIMEFIQESPPFPVGNTEDCGHLIASPSLSTTE